MQIDAVRLIAKELQLSFSSESRALYFHGTSMYPFLVEGDEVIVVPVSWRDIHVGDVVTYRFADKFPTRRVVRKTARDVRLWCDNWPQQRFAASRADVLGRAVARKRDGRWITPRHPEWRAARRAALVSYVRRVLAPDCARLPRRIAGVVARRLGLRRPRRAAPSAES
jgi:hypothetical protein